MNEPHACCSIPENVYLNNSRFDTFFFVSFVCVHCKAVLLPNGPSTRTEKKMLNAKICTYSPCAKPEMIVCFIFFLLLHSHRSYKIEIKTQYTQLHFIRLSYLFSFNFSNIQMVSIKLFQNFFLFFFLYCVVFC